MPHIVASSTISQEEIALQDLDDARERLKRITGEMQAAFTAELEKAKQTLAPNATKSFERTTSTLPMHKETWPPH